MIVSQYKVKAFTWLFVKYFESMNLADAHKWYCHSEVARKQVVVRRGHNWWNWGLMKKFSTNIQCWISYNPPQALIVFYKNKARDTANAIVSWLHPKQWTIVHTSDLMMIIRRSIYMWYIYIYISQSSPGKWVDWKCIYCIVDNWKNVINLTHTLDKIYLTGIL